MKNLEVENEIKHEEPSKLEILNLTEWLIFKIKIIYGRGIYEGDTSDEASAIRQEWHDLVLNLGKKGVLATVNYLLSGHHTVPSFPPSPVEFKKCYRTHISPSIEIRALTKSHTLTKEQRQIGQQNIKEILAKLKTVYFHGKMPAKNPGRTGSKVRN